MLKTRSGETIVHSIKSFDTAVWLVNALDFQKEYSAGDMKKDARVLQNT